MEVDSMNDLVDLSKIQSVKLLHASKRAPCAPHRKPCAVTASAGGFGGFASEWDSGVALKKRVAREDTMIHHDEPPCNNQGIGVHPLLVFGCLRLPCNLSSMPANSFKGVPVPLTLYLSPYSESWTFRLSKDATTTKEMCRMPRS